MLEEERITIIVLLRTTREKKKKKQQHIFPILISNVIGQGYHFVLLYFWQLKIPSSPTQLHYNDYYYLL